MFAVIVLMAVLTLTPALATENPLCVENRHSQALLIGNKDYRETFAVPYAHNDVAAMKTFLVERLCYREGNVTVLKNATFNDMRAWLGTDRNPRGLLWNRTRKGRSNAFVYYSGHGVPDAETRKAYLLTVDTRPDQPSFGYSLDRLDENLRALNDHIGPRRTVMLVLDACFSGRSAGGALQAHSGAIRPQLPSGTDVLRFTASGAGQLAFWNKRKKLGLFTSVFLDAASGAADKAEKGNRDGKVSGKELVAYLAEEVAYRARSLIGKEQTPTVPDGDTLGWEFSVAMPRHAAGGAAREWDRVRNSKSLAALRAFKARHDDPFYRALADERIALLRTPPPPVKERCGDLLVTVGTGEKCLKPGDVFEDCKGCPSMVVVPAGSFTMGSPANEPMREASEGPQHKVSIPRAFAVGRLEITRGQFVEFVTATGHRTERKCWTLENGEAKERPGRYYLAPGFDQDESHPAVCVSWKDAKAYVSWLSFRTGNTYRLLSEAEWEYAARAGTTTPFSTGRTITTDQANFNGNTTYNGSGKGRYRGQTTPVGSFPANHFGLHDMHGNVWEWVEDCWNDNYAGAPTDGSSWTSFFCFRRVFRGGSWYNSPRVLRSANRFRGYSDNRFNFVGFRVARTLTP